MRTVDTWCPAINWFSSNPVFEDENFQSLKRQKLIFLCHCGCVVVCLPGGAHTDQLFTPPPFSPTLPHPPEQIRESSRPYQESKVGAAANPCNTRSIILTTRSAIFFHPFVFPVNDLGEMFQQRPLVVLNEEQDSKDNSASLDFFFFRN